MSTKPEVPTNHRDAGMDWEQVRMNGGPPCFYDCGNGTLCGRAERWFGHPAHHAYVSLAEYSKPSPEDLQGR